MILDAPPTTQYEECTPFRGMLRSPYMKMPSFSEGPRSEPKSGVHPISREFKSPEKQYRLILGTTKRILKLLEEEKDLLTSILEAEASTERAKQSYERNRSPQTKKEWDGAFDTLEKLEMEYQQYLPPALTPRHTRYLTWTQRMERMDRNIEKQYHQINLAERALEKLSASKTSPAQESA